MVTISGHGQSRRSSRHARTQSTRDTRDTRGRSFKALPVDDAPQDPNVDEIRRRRTMYYSDPTAARRRHSANDLARSRSRESKELKDGVRVSTRRSNSDAQHPRKHRTLTTSKVEKRGQSSGNRIQDYVYNTRPVRHDSVHGHRYSRSPSPVSSLSTIADNEVTPDDSISQVAERMYSRRHRTPSRSQSTTQKSSSKTTKLAPIVEKDLPASTPASPARRSSRRDSNIFGSIWRREAAPTTAPPAPRLVECLTCGADDVPYARSAKLACKHRMCHSCLKRIFEMSVKDPTHMPPRCCTQDPIPLKHVDRIFDTKFKVLWNRKYEEYNTKNRIYCPTPKCGEWIKPSHIHTSMGRKYAQCPRCNTKVCTLCKGKLHKVKECPKDPEIVQLVEHAKQQGWQSCYSCHAMVELKEGCNHMTCRCKAEFCMICGKKWKTCECPWFNYNRLPDPADRLNEMRVPERIRQIYQGMFDVAAGLTGYGAAPAEATPPAAIPEPAPPPAAGPRARRAMTYTEEVEARRRQERLDADLARRMQLASLLNPHDHDRDRDNSSPARPRHAEAETWGVGNAASHFMNDDYVQHAAHVAMGGFGDSEFGRRGERAAGRRRRPRTSSSTQRNSTVRDAGLVPNFLGDESVLGAATRGSRRGG